MDNSVDIIYFRIGLFWTSLSLMPSTPALTDFFTWCKLTILLHCETVQLSLQLSTYNCLNKNIVVSCNVI